MKISIVIPYHGGEAYLRDCLDSLKEQSYTDTEVLLVCDRVKEEDLSLVMEYQSQLTIKVFHLKGKKGVAAARNLGLDKASGEYIYFLDSDDYLYGNTLENMASAAQDRYDDIVYGKKKPTWFQRSVYLARKQQEVEDAEEESQENENESAEPGSEAAHEDRKEGSEYDDIGDGAEENDKNEDNEDSENHLDGNAGGEEAEDDLTPEEIKLRRQSRTKQAYRILVSKRKGIANISVLNILFKRSYLEENRIRFQEDLKYYSDIPFLLEALAKTDKFKKRLSALYIKRKHNDAVNQPSLSQVKDSRRFAEFMNAYQTTVKKISDNEDLRNRFDKKYISYYTRVYATRMKRNSKDIWRKEYFLSFSDMVCGMNPEVIKGLKGYKKRVIKALMKKDVKKSLTIIKFHLAARKISKIFKNRREMAKFLYAHIFLKRPVKKNWILFESFYGKSYSDSPKYIYEYLAKNSLGKYKFIWVLNETNKSLPYPHKQVKRFGIRHCYYLARCKYYVYNERQPLWVVKREGNVFLQTWHGTPLKKLVFDIDDVSSASPKYKQEVYKQSRDWDYLIAPNAFCSETFRRCFMYEKDLLETGYPRNDILHAPKREEIAARVKRNLNIPERKKVILYAPTWRDDEFYDHGQYKFDLELDLNLMQQRLGEEYVVLLRLHYFVADSVDVSGLSGFAYDLSRYDDISELYLISDILITDYSSVFFDFANLRRPMLFFTYDLEKYRDVLRGFYFDIEALVPGPLLYTTEEILDALQDLESIRRKYEQKYEDFYSRFCAWEDGHATEKVVKSVFIEHI